MRKRPRRGAVMFFTRLFRALIRGARYGMSPGMFRRRTSGTRHLGELG